MSHTKRLTNITNKQIADKGVQALANRPNAAAQYGVGGLSPAQLKLWFDKLATFMAEKINEIQNTLSSVDAADYIRLDLDKQGVENLGDLSLSFLDGTFAGNILQVYPSASAFHTLSLQTAINDIAQALSTVEESIDALTVLLPYKIAQTTGNNKEIPISQWAATQALEGKIDKNVGTNNKFKILAVDENGNICFVPIGNGLRLTGVLEAYSGFLLGEATLGEATI